MDDILLNKDHIIPNELKKMLKTINTKGYLVVITSSMNHKLMQEVLFSIDGYYHFFIGNNGGIWIDKIKNETHKTLKIIGLDFLHNILQDTILLNGIIQIMTSKKILISSETNIVKLRNVSWLSQEIKDEYIEPFTKYTKGSLKENEIIQLSIFLEKTLLNELMLFFKTYYKHEYEFSVSFLNTVDINALGVSKYECVKKIASLYYIDKENIFCFTNAQNDLNLVTNIDHSYVLDTANNLLIEKAKNIISTKNYNQNNNIVSEVEKIIIIKNIKD